MNKENAPKFNQVGYKDINNYWWKRKYDENNNIIEEVNSNGLIVTKEYNENGCILKQSDSLGIIKTFEYDERNNLIYTEITCKDKIIDTYWVEYNEKDLMIYEKRDGYDTFYKYNENGDIISKISQAKLSYSVEYEYLDNIKKEHKIYSDGREVWITVNIKEHSISFEDNRGCKWDKKFDENGFNLNEYEHILEYDENNNLIHHKNSSGIEYWNEWEAAK